MVVACGHEFSKQGTRARLSQDPLDNLTTRHHATYTKGAKPPHLMLQWSIHIDPIILQQLLICRHGPKDLSGGGTEGKLVDIHVGSKVVKRQTMFKSYPFNIINAHRQNMK